jgi:hypothetical protein
MKDQSNKKIKSKLENIIIRKRLQDYIKQDNK